MKQLLPMFELADNISEQASFDALGYIGNELNKIYIEPVLMTKNKFEYEIKNYWTKIDLKDITGRLYDIDGHIEHHNDDLKTHSNEIFDLCGSIDKLQ